MILIYTNDDGFYSYEFTFHYSHNVEYVGVTTSNIKNDGTIHTSIEVKDNALCFKPIDSRGVLHLSDAAINYVNRMLKLKAFW